MSLDDEFMQDYNGQDTMLKEAMDALRNENPARARDLLTRLLKTDQKNPTYWIWLSAAVETQKEKIYCLQMALRADPENATAKRGLRILGALEPDPDTPPFPINRTRQWEEKLVVPLEPKVKKKGWANPILRPFIVVGLAILVLGVPYLGWSMITSNRAYKVAHYTPTHHPTFTLTPTPSDTPEYRTFTPTFMGATPLSIFLDSTYTPTPLYVMTVHPVTSRNAFEAGLRFLAAKDYANALVLFKQAIDLEPHAPDLYYYVGETYMQQGDYHSARDAFQEAIHQDATFAPGFFGRALANLAINPKLDVMTDLGEAIRLDPGYAEAYIERGSLLIATSPSQAKNDLLRAVELRPNSADAYLYLANAQLALGDNQGALASATKANQLDVTLIPVYLALARAYIGSGQPAMAVSVLQTYTVYAPEDSKAFLQLGTAYNAAGQYQDAVDILTRAISADRKSAEAYFQRGTAYLALQKPNLAEDDFTSALTYDPTDFDSQIGLATSYDMQGLPGQAYMQVEQSAAPLAKANETRAQVYYWEAHYLTEMGDAHSLLGAKIAWNQLIALPAEVMPPEWRAEAFQGLNITPTFTPSPKVTKTPTATLKTPIPVEHTATP